jgi:hypothetical protein
MWTCGRGTAWPAPVALRMLVLVLVLGPGRGAIDPSTALAARHRRPPRPIVVRKPVVAGVPAAAATLTAATGRWRGAHPISYAYRWLRCHDRCSPIPGADGQQYRIAQTDVGARVLVEVIARNRAGTARATSDPTPVIGPSSDTVERGLYSQLQPRDPSTTVALKLVTGGYELQFEPVTAGRLRISWFVGAHAGTGTLIADGEGSFPRVAPSQVRLEFTSEGRALFQRLRSVTVTALAVYTAPYMPAVSTSRTFRLA